MKLYIGSVVWREEVVAHSQAMRQLWTHLNTERIKFVDGTVVGDALVSRSRSIVASSFLRSDAHVLMTIDSDIWFSPQDVVKICGEASELGIVGGCYLTRSLTAQPAMMLPDREVMFSADAKPVEVPFASTGFMAVHRRVFERLSQDLPLCHKGWNDRGADTSFWPFYMPFTIPWEGDGHMYLSEDWAFCQRAKDAGFGAWLDPSIRLGHYASVMLTLEDLMRPVRPPAQPIMMRRSRSGELEVHGAQLAHAGR